MNKKLIVILFILHFGLVFLSNIGSQYDISFLYDLSAPYLLSVSTWQQWNLFAPDPHLTKLSTRVVMEDTIIERDYAVNGMKGLFSRLRKFDENLVNLDRQELFAYLAYHCRTYGHLLEGEYSVRLEKSEQRLGIPVQKNALTQTTQLSEMTCS